MMNFTAIEHRPLDPTSRALIGALDRLEEIIDGEFAALEQNRSFDVEAFNHRKSRSLLELSRLPVPTEAPDEVIRSRLPRLRSKLSRNQELLAIHLAAAREISDVLAKAMHDAESDGTYSAVVGGAAR